MHRSQTRTKRVGFCYPCQKGEQINIIKPSILEPSFPTTCSKKSRFRLPYPPQRVKIHIPPKPLPSMRLPFAISVPPAATACRISIFVGNRRHKLVLHLFCLFPSALRQQQIYVSSTAGKIGDRREVQHPYPSPYYCCCLCCSSAVSIVRGMWGPKLMLGTSRC
jgi:hypothetical protein